MTEKEVMQMALDLEKLADRFSEGWHAGIQIDASDVMLLLDSAEALRAALAQPEQAECDGGQCGIGGYCKQCPKTQPEPEPVAWTVSGLITDFSRDFSAYQTKTYTRPLYTAPPQREWQGLTNEEYEAMVEQYVTNCYFDTLKYAKGIEAKLKEKNT
jgi:hypothetical protein